MKEFFTGYSKKLIAFLVTVGVILLNGWLDLGLSEQALLTLTGGFGAYAIGQGLADFGKERVKIADREMAREAKICPKCGHPW